MKGDFKENSSKFLQNLWEMAAKKLLSIISIIATRRRISRLFSRWDGAKIANVTIFKFSGLFLYDVNLSSFQ